MSVIYSTSAQGAQGLRTFKNGQLKINDANVLPEYEPCSNAQCYFAGDGRVTQTSALALCHSIFYRLHNIIASKLSECNPSWDDDRIFKEARRITIAIYQQITFLEWLIIILGD